MRLFRTAPKAHMRTGPGNAGEITVATILSRRRASTDG
jgi:hypothetical protein